MEEVRAGIEMFDPVEVPKLRAECLREVDDDGRADQETLPGRLDRG